MKVSTIIVLAVLGLLVFMYLRREGMLMNNTSTAGTEPKGNTGGQQVSGDVVFKGVLDTVNRIFDSVERVAQTSTSSV